MRPTRPILSLLLPALVAAACAGHVPPPSSAHAEAADATEGKPARVAEVKPAVESPAPAAVPAPELSPAAEVTSPPPTTEPKPADRGDGAHPGFRVPAFKTTVRRPSPQGVAEQPFDSRATKKPTLYVVNSTTCPYCAQYVDRMKALEAKYMPLGVDVVHVYPNRAEPADEKVAWHAKQAFLGGQILDSDAAIARALEADRTPTVYLVGGDGVIVYRGAIDGSAYPKEGVAPVAWAAAAIEAQLAGRPIAESETEPEG